MTDEETARLLRMVDARPSAPADRAARVRHVVHVRWQSEIRRRTVRRRAVIAFGVLATAGVLGIAVRLTGPPLDEAAPPLQTVATVQRVDGDARRLSSDRRTRDRRTPLSSGMRLTNGDRVETGPAGGTALQLMDGSSVRLAAGSTVVMLAATVIELTAGTVYVDTGRDSTGLEVRTRFGTARDIGTQFEVHVASASTRVRVRTGLVELRHGDEVRAARPGTELTVTPDEAISRTVPVYGPDWDWVVALAPAFPIEGRPLAAFLEHLSREHAWTLRYADPEIARDASGIIMHGSVEGLAPRDALSVALTTSGLDHRFTDGELLILPH